MKKCKAMMQKFQWLRREHNNWVDYYAHKKWVG